MAGRNVETLLDAIKVDDTPQVDDTPHSSSQHTYTPSQKARQNLNQLKSASATEAKTSRRAPLGQQIEYKQSRGTPIRQWLTR
jgi:hypothetical protein